MAAEREVGVEVVGYLCQDAGPVYAVDGCQAERAVDLWVGEESFEDVLDTNILAEVEGGALQGKCLT